MARLDARSRHLFSLNGVSFNYKRRPDGTVHAEGAPDLNATHFGFIAQEVEGRFPELVGKNSDGMRSVQYSAFVPLIVEGMKALRTDIASASAGVKALQGAADRAQAGAARVATVTVKGLAATGAVTAHHGLAQRLPWTGAEAETAEDTEAAGATSAEAAAAAATAARIGALEAANEGLRAEVAAARAESASHRHETAALAAKVAAVEAALAQLLLGGPQGGPPLGGPRGGAQGRSGAPAER